MLGEADLVDPALRLRSRRSARPPRPCARSTRPALGGACGSRRSQPARRRARGRRASVTLSRRGSPSTTRTRPPRASTRLAQSACAACCNVGSERASRRTEATNACGVCTVTSPSRSSVSTTASPSTRLTVSAIGRAGNRPVPPVGERRDHPLDHLVRHERARGVVDEHDRRLLGHLGQRCPHRLAAALAAGHRRGDLAGGDLLGDEDARLLPLGRRGDDDPVDPVRGVETLEALGDQRPVVQRRERLGPVQPETVTASCCSQDRPDAHGRPRLRLRRDLRPGLLGADAREDVVEPLRGLFLVHALCVHELARRGSSWP